MLELENVHFGPVDILGCAHSERNLVRIPSVIINCTNIVSVYNRSVVTRRAQNKPEAGVAVHCVAGLGRAPVMVAIALIELGMKYEEAVETIRE